MIDRCRKFAIEMGGEVDDEKIDNEFAGWFKDHVSVVFVSLLSMSLN